MCKCRQALDIFPFLKWPYSIVMFWPTVLFARAWSWGFPQQRRVWDRIPGTPIVVGAVPLWSYEFSQLKDMGVAAVVNLCIEWEPDIQQLESHALLSLHVPVVDMTPPTQAQLMQCVRWITEALTQARGEGKPDALVYVHCKAGRGRSVLVAAACLMVWGGLSPSDAAGAILAVRPHASDKSKHPALLQLHATLTAPISGSAVDAHGLREAGATLLGGSAST